MIARLASLLTVHYFVLHCLNDDSAFSFFDSLESDELLSYAEEGKRNCGSVQLISRINVPRQRIIKERAKNIVRFTQYSLTEPQSFALI